jgi:hypothetical protein
VLSRIQNHQYDKLHTYSDPSEINQTIEREGAAADQQVLRQKHSSDSELLIYSPDLGLYILLQYVEIRRDAATK